MKYRVHRSKPGLGKGQGWEGGNPLLMIPRRNLRSHVMNPSKLQQNARRASSLLRAMSNQHRLMILCQLTSGEKCVGELERMIGLSQSALSQHLARLRRDELVKTRREAQTIFYSLAGPEAQTVIETLYGLYCGRNAEHGAMIEQAHEPPEAVAA